LDRRWLATVGRHPASAARLATSSPQNPRHAPQRLACLCPDADGRAVTHHRRPECGRWRTNCVARLAADLCRPACTGSPVWT
jgi:hypothetical protein